MFGRKQRSTDELLRYFVTGELGRAVDMSLEQIPGVKPPRVIHVDRSAYLLQAYSVMRWSWLVWMGFKFVNWRMPEGEKSTVRLPFFPPLDYTFHFAPLDFVGEELPLLKRLSSQTSITPAGCTLTYTFSSLDSLEDHLRNFVHDVCSPRAFVDDHSPKLEDLMAQQRTMR